MPITVTGLAITPVKSTRLRLVDQIRLERAGVRENRRFYLIDARDHLLNAKRLGELCALVADYSESRRRLRLTFPDGRVVEDSVRPGDQITTRWHSGTAVGRLVDGPWSEALSDFARQPVRLVEANGTAVDRREGGGASLISRASLARLAAAGGERDVDGRRFRMLIEIDGVAAHAEDGWVGGRTRIGEAVVRWLGHVGRCLITSRDPETGVIDLPTLDILRGYRHDLETTEPLPFGIYGEVVRAGTVRVGDELVTTVDVE
jgi:uncharacterized protein YcbX